MKWHSVNITIAATLAITLPCEVIGAYCDEKSWNHTLKLQHQLDQNYNFHATRFNQFLQIHHSQPFLYQEFTQVELRALWLSEDRSFRQRLQSQALASTTIIGHIEEERVMIAPLQSQATTLKQKWRQISADCLKTGNQANRITSSHYVQLNQALSIDLEGLSAKLDVLKSRYEKERDLLEATKPNPQ